jgi:translation initiation factor 1
MSKKKTNSSGFIVFSSGEQESKNDLSSLFGNLTGSGEREPEPESTDNSNKHKQAVRVWLERQKGNREATVIKGVELNEDALNELAKLLKNKCAAGGNAKDGEIIIQGNHREKVLKLLLEMGYKNAKKAGG